MAQTVHNDTAGVAGTVAATETAPPRRGMSRRRLLGNGTAGVAAAGILANIPGLGSLFNDASEAPAIGGEAAAVEGASGPQSVVAHIRDVRNGFIDLHTNGTTINVHDPQLARAIARSAR